MRYGHKISTFIRIQSYEIRSYIRLFFFVLLIPARIVFNLIVILLTPIWIAPVYMFMTVREAIKNKKSRERQVLTGQIWFHDQFRMY